MLPTARDSAGLPSRASVPELLISAEVMKAVTEFVNEAIPEAEEAFKKEGVVLIGTVAGCQYRNRCEYARGGCTEDVALHPLGGGRAYRCVLDEAECAANAADAAA